MSADKYTSLTETEQAALLADMELFYSQYDLSEKCPLCDNPVRLMGVYVSKDSSPPKGQISPYVYIRAVMPLI